MPTRRITSPEPLSVTPATPPTGATESSSTENETADLIEDTIGFWQPRYGRPLTREDARQIIENLVGFFTTLQRWAAAERAGKEDEDTPA
jgi:hypothetical protein